MTSEQIARIIADVADRVDRRLGRSWCRCHALPAAQCPGAGTAGRRPVGPGGTGQRPETPAGLIDSTLLKPDATGTAIDALCDEAARCGFATVCVNPVWVKRASDRLGGSTVGVCSVVGFPLGALTAAMKHEEALAAITDGARELDMVMNIGAMKSDDLVTVLRDVEAVTEPAARAGAVVKVIIETALLTDEEKVTASVLARGGGAAYVKTSTGFGPGGATVGDVSLLRRVLGPETGIKAAGGIRHYAALVALVEAGASRIGTSAGHAILAEWQAAQRR